MERIPDRQIVLLTDKKTVQCQQNIYLRSNITQSDSSSEQSTSGVTSQVQENHSQRNLHRGPGGERSGLAVGGPGWRQWKEREGRRALHLIIAQDKNLQLRIVIALNTQLATWASTNSSCLSIPHYFAQNPMLICIPVT